MIPKKITAGTTFNRLMVNANYPASDGWLVKFYLRGSTQSDFTSTDEGDNHRLLISASTTATWQAGNYAYTLRVEKSGEVVELESGNIQVMPDIAAMEAGYDARTQAEKALEAIEAVLAGRASKDQERYRINDRELYRTPIPDLIKLRGFYAAQVNRERHGRNPVVGRVLTRFPGC